MRKQKGFTLLEILLVVAIIAILAGIIILAINPAKQLGDSRNAQRQADVNTILSAVYQYMIDGNTVPSAINTGSTCNSGGNEVCQTTGSCSGYTNLNVLTTDEKYLVAMPADPLNDSSNGTGYFITKDSNNRITVCAPSAENSITISATR